MTGLCPSTLSVIWFPPEILFNQVTNEVACQYCYLAHAQSAIAGCVVKREEYEFGKTEAWKDSALQGRVSSDTSKTERADGNESLIRTSLNLLNFFSGSF